LGIKKDLSASGDKKRIMLITPMLHQGGFERICVLTARLLADLYDVYLVVFTMEDAFYDVSGIRLIDLHLGAVQGKLGKAVNLLRRARELSRLQRELDIDVVYSFGQTANMANALSSHGSGRRHRRINKIAACHSFGEIGVRNYMDLILRRTDHVICCSKAMAEEVRERYHTQHVDAVWNPCDLADIRRKMTGERPAAFGEIFSGEERVIVSMGREDDVKGFWHLIRAFGRVQEQLPGTRLVIIGEGSFDEYRELADKIGILPQVIFAGTQRNPFPLLAAGSVYALTSISEGLPNALVEALAAGLVIVSANCRSGPAEILHGDWQQAQSGSGVQYADYGVLTPALSPRKDLQVRMADGKICLEEAEEALAGAIITLLQDRELYRRYSERAQERAMDFSAEKYKEAVIRLIEA
jgi:glycosyltransferase involved in cell wall biosynthesis